MQPFTEEYRSGRDYLDSITTLLQRIRTADPTAGLYQAAELQFWWSTPQPTDGLAQLFWFDDTGLPAAAAVLADFSGGNSLVYDSVMFCPFVLPGASAETVESVVERGLARAGDCGFDAVELEVDQADTMMQGVLTDRGITLKEPAVVTECWMDAAGRPAVSTLADGYRLTRRSETAGRPHHMSERNPAFREGRLTQASIYRPDLDLEIVDQGGQHAAAGLFWYDPVTSTGVIEPMRTHVDHQQRGLARHLLTAGIDMLARAGAARINIGYEPDNPVSGSLYRSVGFVPERTTDLYHGPTNRPTTQAP